MPPFNKSNLKTLHKKPVVLWIIYIHKIPRFSVGLSIAGEVMMILIKNFYRGYSLRFMSRKELKSNPSVVLSHFMPQSLQIIC